MRPLLGLLRRLFGLEKEETVPETVRAAPKEGQGPSGGDLPRGSGTAVFTGGGEMPRGTGLPSFGDGKMPGSGTAEAVVFSGAEVRGTAEGFAGALGGAVPPGREGASFSPGGTAEVLVLAGPPEDGARALSELLRFQRRMGSTVGDFGEEVL